MRTRGGKHVLYVGSFGTPDSSASGQRVINIAKMLDHHNCHVHFIMTNSRSGFEKHQGFSFQTIDVESNLGVIDRYIELVCERRLFEAVTRYCETHPVDTVLVYNDIGFLESKLISFCRERGILIYGDVTEWFSHAWGQTIGEHLKTFSVAHRIRRTDRRLDGVLSISAYLHSHYLKQGVPSFDLPPVFDLDGFPHYVPGSGPLRLAYAGYPGKKDDLGSVIRAFVECDVENDRLVLEILGPSKHYVETQYESCFRDKGVVPDNIIIHGKRSHEFVLETLSRADACFIIREPRRYAKAGFSTKLAECMLSGVAVICNSVGGAERLIDDGHQGFLMKNARVEDIKRMITRLVNLDRSELERVKIASIEFARGHFAAERYSSDLYTFLFERDA